MAIFLFGFMFVKKPSDVAMSKTKLLLFIANSAYSIFYLTSGVNNVHLFVISDTDTFPGKKSLYIAVTSCQSQNVSLFSSFS